MLKVNTMEETQPLRFARLLQMVRSMEADLGINALNKSEKMLFTCVGDLFTQNCMHVGVLEDRHGLCNCKITS